MGIYICVDLCQQLCWEQGNFTQTLLGTKANHGVVCLIYEKVLRLSSATNKHFSQGEIMNFIDVDVEKISNLAYVLPFVASLPVQLIFSLTLLFYYFGISLFAGITMGIIFGTINYNLAKVRAGVQEMILKEKDQRMRHTTEAVDHIKTIKFNSWSRLFIDKILGVRNREVYLVKVSIILDALDSFLARMVTPSLVISTLGVFLSLGGEISIAKAYAGIQVFTYLEMPLRWFPEFVSSFLEFTVSMKRIQNFLLCNELNPDILSIKDTSLDKTNIDLKISNGNFTWGGVKQTKFEVTKEFDQGKCYN